MNYKDFTNEQIATVVSFAIAYDNCEGSRRLFYEKYEKEAPPASTIRDWRNRFLETLSLEPRKRIEIIQDK